MPNSKRRKNITNKILLERLRRRLKELALLEEAAVKSLDAGNLAAAAGHGSSSLKYPTIFDTLEKYAKKQPINPKFIEALRGMQNQYPEAYNKFMDKAKNIMNADNGFNTTLDDLKVAVKPVAPAGGSVKSGTQSQPKVEPKTNQPSSSGGKAPRAVNPEVKGYLDKIKAAKTLEQAKIIAKQAKDAGVINVKITREVGKIRRLVNKAGKVDAKKLIKDLTKETSQQGRIARLKVYLKGLGEKSPTLRLFKRLQRKLAKMFGPAFNRVKDLFVKAGKKIKAAAISSGRFIARRVPSYKRMQKKMNRMQTDPAKAKKYAQKLLKSAKTTEELKRVQKIINKSGGPGGLNANSALTDDILTAEKRIGAQTQSKGTKTKTGNKTTLNPKGRPVFKPGGKADQAYQKATKKLYAAMLAKAKAYPKTAGVFKKVGAKAGFVFKFAPPVFAALELYSLYADWDNKTTETKITDTAMAGVNIALMVVEFPLALAWMASTGATSSFLNSLMGPIDDVYYQIEKMAKARIGKLGIFVAGGSTYDTQGLFNLGDGVVGRSDSEGEVFKKYADTGKFKGLRPKDLNKNYIELIMIAMLASEKAKSSGLFEKIKGSSTKPIAKLERLFKYSVLNRYFFEKKLKEWKKKTTDDALKNVNSKLATQTDDGFSKLPPTKGDIVINITEDDVNKVSAEEVAKIANSDSGLLALQDSLNQSSKEGDSNSKITKENLNYRLKQLIIAL